MSEIRTLTRNGEVFYPLTHNEAVIGMNEFKETIINQTNHNYYNLSGDFTQPAYDMVLYVNADNFTPSDRLYIPTGEI
jgi:galactose mutarotase-like enzyme